MEFVKGGTTVPPALMLPYELRVPKRSSLFVNVMHNVNTTRTLYNVTDANGTIGVAFKEEIINNMFYFGTINTSIYLFSRHLKIHAIICGVLMRIVFFYAIII